MTKQEVIDRVQLDYQEIGTLKIKLKRVRNSEEIAPEVTGIGWIDREAEIGRLKLEIDHLLLEVAIYNKWLVMDVWNEEKEKKE